MELKELKSIDSTMISVNIHQTIGFNSLSERTSAAITPFNSYYSFADDADGTDKISISVHPRPSPMKN